MKHLAILFSAVAILASGCEPATFSSGVYDIDPEWYMALRRDRIFDDLGTVKALAKADSVEGVLRGINQQIGGWRWFISFHDGGTLDYFRQAITEPDGNIIFSDSLKTTGLWKLSPTAETLFVGIKGLDPQHRDSVTTLYMQVGSNRIASLRGNKISFVKRLTD